MANTGYFVTSRGTDQARRAVLIAAECDWRPRTRADFEDGPRRREQFLQVLEVNLNAGDVDGVEWVIRSHVGRTSPEFVSALAAYRQQVAPAPAITPVRRVPVARADAPRRVEIPRASAPIVRPPRPFDLVARIAPCSWTCDRASYPDGSRRHAFNFEPGCFAHTLASKIPIPCLLNHDSNQVLARDRGDGLLLWATSVGLFAAVRLKAAHESLRAALSATAAWRAAGCPSPAPAGVFTGASPGFLVIESRWVRGAGVEYITRASLAEVSLILSPDKPGFGSQAFVVPGPHAAHELLTVCA